MKKYVITLILGILLLGLGCGYCTFEILDFDYMNTINPKIHIEKDTKEYPIDMNHQYEIDVKNGIIKIQVDNTLEDTMMITTSYPTAYAVLDYRQYKEHHTKQELIYKFHRTMSNQEIKNIFNTIIKDIKHKRFYNYPETFTPIVEIHISKENLKFIDVDEDKIW